MAEMIPPGAVRVVIEGGPDAIAYIVSADGVVRESDGEASDLDAFLCRELGQVVDWALGDAEREALFEEYRAGRACIADEDLEAFTAWSAARGERPLAAGGSGVAGSAG